MEFFKKIKMILTGRGDAAIDFKHLSKKSKVELLEREAQEFGKKYGQVIKKLAHE